MTCACRTEAIKVAFMGLLLEFIAGVYGFYNELCQATYDLTRYIYPSARSTVQGYE